MRFYHRTISPEWIRTVQDLGCCDGLYLDQGLKIFQETENLPEVVATLAGRVEGPVFLSLQAACPRIPHERQNTFWKSSVGPPTWCPCSFPTSWGWKCWVF